MSSYFSYLPNIEYIDRTSNEFGSYILAKNLFKRIKIRELLIDNASAFVKYNIIGDSRPDNVAYEIYDDASLDWIILITNNILDVRSEWPLSQSSYNKYLLKKYGTYDNIYSVHHYETREVRNLNDEIVLPGKITVSPNFTFEYYDFLQQTTTSIPDPIVPVTNFDLEEAYQTKIRSINILRPRYLPLILEDIEKLMPYKPGSQQYVKDNLKRVADIRITE
jgi:hypothetical protein